MTLQVLKLMGEVRSAAARWSAALFGFFYDLVALAVPLMIRRHNVPVATAVPFTSTAPWLYPPTGRNDQVGVVVPQPRAVPLLAAAPQAGSKARATTKQASERGLGGSTLGTLRLPSIVTALALRHGAQLAPAPMIQ